jgi:hypothetical protein
VSETLLMELTVNQFLSILFTFFGYCFVAVMGLTVVCNLIRFIIEDRKKRRQEQSGV